jgi:hypothetical protein
MKVEIDRIHLRDRSLKGSIYLETGHHGFLFTDTYGFVYRPNPKDSVHFREDLYEYHRIVDEWYWFKAINPW